MKKFNITGVCVSTMHYMVDTSKKLEKIIKMIDHQEYFTINRARQFGKTTTLNILFNRLSDKYLAIKTSFEGLGDAAFLNEESFCQAFMDEMAIQLQNLNISEMYEIWIDDKKMITSIQKLSMKITDFCKRCPKPIVLLIDEVDKSTNNQLFLNFLGMLRNKYLSRNEGNGYTFHSVVLAGVYDVKTLKLKLRPDDSRQYNSPWNIAAEFDVDMTFHPEEIATMLVDYEQDYHTGMDIAALSNEIYKFTTGYPFLVSKVCKTIEEKLDRKWTVEGVQQAVKQITKEKNTLFTDLTKNLENYPKFKELVFLVSMQNKEISFDVNNPEMELGILFSVIKDNGKGKVAIHNLIFEEVIYNYFIAERSITENVRPKYQANYVVDEKLNMDLVITRFQQLMYEEYRKKEENFIEREARLLFLCFLKPIINGSGFYYVEAETRNMTRTDLIVTFGGEEFIIEMKIWHGSQYDTDGKEQLSEYLRVRNKEKGYLITFSFLKDKKIEEPHWIEFSGKKIFEAVI